MTDEAPMTPTVVLVPWFLWSIVYPGGAYYDKDIRATAVKEAPTQAACEVLKAAYQVEVDKAYPKQQGGGWQMIPWVRLVCSPVNPKP